MASFAEDVDINRRAVLTASAPNLPPAHPHRHAYIALSLKTRVSLVHVPPLHAPRVETLGGGGAPYALGGKSSPLAAAPLGDCIS